MDFETYQKQSRETAVYPNSGSNYIYPTLGLAGETGEVAEKIKKAVRDHNGVIDDARRADIEKELGDVLWYVSQIASELGLSLDQVAAKNIEKLLSRKARNVLTGSGD